MSQSAVETVTSALPALTLRPGESTEQKPTEALTAPTTTEEEPYRYAHLLPVFNDTHYPPLEPFPHTDPGARALSHAHPRAFLDGADSVHDITPFLGTEVRGVSLARLGDEGRDQLALEVRRFKKWLGGKGANERL